MTSSSGTLESSSLKAIFVGIRSSSSAFPSVRCLPSGGDGTGRSPDSWKHSLSGGSRRPSDTSTYCDSDSGHLPRMIAAIRSSPCRGRSTSGSRATGAFMGAMGFPIFPSIQDLCDRTRKTSTNGSRKRRKAQQSRHALHRGNSQEEVRRTRRDEEAP